LALQMSSASDPDDSVFQEGRGDEYAVVREIYDGLNAHELFENELERALDSGCPTIVIEPQRLGEETARWISIGACLQKTSLASGFGSLVSSSVCPSKPLIYCPLAAASVLCSGAYALSWRSDPCSKYKVESDPLKLKVRHIISSTAQPPVVLTRRANGSQQKMFFFQTAISLLALAFSAWRAYRCFKFALI